MHDDKPASGSNPDAQLEELDGKDLDQVNGGGQMQHAKSTPKITGSGKPAGKTGPGQPPAGRGILFFDEGDVL